MWRNWAKEELRMDVYLLPLSVFTHVVKCNPGPLPNFTPHDFHHFVINNPSNYTGWDLKPYKSLEAYQYFVSRWVRSLSHGTLPGTVVTGSSGHCSGIQRMFMKFLILTWLCVLSLTFSTSQCRSLWLMRVILRRIVENIHNFPSVSFCSPLFPTVTEPFFGVDLTWVDVNLACAVRM